MNRKRIVLTQGVFDLLHSNHIAMLREAKAFGDYLIVGVHSDDIVRSYKRKPILCEQERLLQIEAVRYVDEAFVDRSPLNAAAIEAHIQTYRPDHFVYCGEGWDEMFAPAIKRGILRRLAYHEGISTSQILKTIRKRLADNSL